MDIVTDIESIHKRIAIIKNINGGIFKGHPQFEFSQGV